MGLIDDCSSFFGTPDLYQVLSLEKNASDAQLKKAYRKASLLTHPDKVGDDQREAATRKFQVLSKVHFILSDPEKRGLYDESGIVDEEDAVGSSDPDFWDSYWRTLFPKITLKDIDDFMAKYKGSNQQIEDLTNCYIQYEGDMNKISECFIGYQVEEEDQYRKILNDMIAEKKIPSFPTFVNEPAKKKLARQKKLKKEQAEAEEMSNDDESLLNAIARRGEERKSQFESLISRIERKYGQEPPKRKKK